MLMLVFWVAMPCELVGNVDTNILEEHTVSILRANFSVTTSVLFRHYNPEDQHQHVRNVPFRNTFYISFHLLGLEEIFSKDMFQFLTGFTG
jgi:hypothetical protein